MAFIKVWCEYDFSGQFGGNNDQDVFWVSDEQSEEKDKELVLNYLKGQTGLSEEDLEGLWGMDYIDIPKLNSIVLDKGY